MKQQSNPVYLILLIIVSCILLFRCDDDSVVIEKLYHEYFPVNTGHWVIYNVDSIVYDDFTGNIDTFHYQVKEVFEEKFIDDSGKEAIRLERFIRWETDQDWQIKNAWVARLLPSRAEKVEENIRFIKLAFPVKINKNWNGNAYNSMPEQTYRYTDVHKPYTINELSFDSVATVLQKDDKTLISKEYQVEKFAKNAGMIYKEYINLKTEVDGSVISGVDYRYEIVDYCNKNLNN